NAARCNDVSPATCATGHRVSTVLFYADDKTWIAGRWDIGGAKRRRPSEAMRAMTNAWHQR
ncbi:MAG TPA: hypothetical protein VFZ07_00345, partial [Dongiaceae bacterium]